MKGSDLNTSLVEYEKKSLEPLKVFDQAMGLLLYTSVGTKVVLSERLSDVLKIWSGLKTK